MSYKLTVAKFAASQFGTSLGKASEARRELCIRLTEEVLAAPLQIDNIFAATKEAAVAAAMKVTDDWSSADDALLRKQFSYVRQIAAGWDKLSDEQRETFTSGALSASSLVAAIKGPKEAKAPKEDKAADQKVSDKAAPTVIGASEMMVHVAAMLEGRELADFSEAEARAYSGLRDAMKAIEARFTKAASKTLKAA